MAFPTYSPSLISAVHHVQQGLAAPKFIMGGRGGASGTTYTLFKQSTTYGFTVWRSQLFTVAAPFNIVAINFQLMTPMAANMTITPVLGFDDGTTIVAGTILNSTNYPNNESAISLSPDHFGFSVHGLNNFYLEFQFSGTALTGIFLPIEIKIETETIL